jgi:NAD(P)-dependent dehydrogenase (short-subunit alcohol dehydrogenase family)
MPAESGEESSMFDFDGRVALVTGGSGALGEALVRRLSAAGARVAAVDRKPERLAPLYADLAEERRPTAHGADLADAAAVDAMAAEVLERHGRIDHLFNVAGAYAGGEPVETTPPATWQKLWDANFRSTLHVCAAVVPAMKRQGSGTVVNVGSRASLGGDAGAAAYAVAKTAVLRLTESLAAEGKRGGVRVNCVLPGTIDTPANRAAMPDADVSTWVELDALVDVLLFLSSPAARAVHGAALPVFGTA